MFATRSARSAALALGLGIAAGSVAMPATAENHSSAPPPSAGAEASRDGATDEEDSNGYLYRVAWVGFGVAAVGYAAWAVTGSISLAKSESLKDDCVDDVCPADSEDDLDTARKLAQVSTASFALGVTGTLWGVIALLVADDEEDDAAEPTGEASIAARPLIGPGYVGVSGQF